MRHGKRSELSVRDAGLLQLLDHVVALKNELGAERRRRIDQLRKAGVPDAQIEPVAVSPDRPSDNEAQVGQERSATAWLRSCNCR